MDTKPGYVDTEDHPATATAWKYRAFYIMDDQTYRGYRGGVRYLIQNESADFKDGALRISITGTSLQDIEVVEYLNQRTLVIQVPFTDSNNVVYQDAAEQH